jgi:hypothetical protein
MWISYRSHPRNAPSTKRNKDNQPHMRKTPHLRGVFVRRNHDRGVNSASRTFPKVPGSVGREKALIPCRSAADFTSGCIWKGLKRTGSAPAFLMVSRRSSPQSGWSQSMTTARGFSRRITSSTGSAFPRNLGCKPRSSTSIPNSAATTSSRARINTVPNASQPREVEPSRQLVDPRDSLAHWRPCLDIQEQMSTLFATSQRVGRTICKNASELTLGKHHEGVAHCADGAAETARRADA